MDKGMVTKLPKVTEQMNCSDLLIFYSDGEYRLACLGADIQSATFRDEYLALPETSLYRLNSDGTAWEWYAATNPLNPFPVRYDYFGESFLCGTFDIYSTDGKCMYRGVTPQYFTRDYTLAGTIVSPRILGYTLSGCMKLVPLCLPVLVGFLAFRKSCAFIKTQIKGA